MSNNAGQKGKKKQERIWVGVQLVSRIDRLVSSVETDSVALLIVGVKKDI